MSIFLETDQNAPEFEPRWNERVSRSSLYIGTRNSDHSDRNETKLTTMFITNFITIEVVDYD